MSHLISEYENRLHISNEEETARTNITDQTHNEHIATLSMLLGHTIEEEDTNRWITLCDFHSENSSLAESFVISYILASKYELEHQQKKNRQAWEDEEQATRKQLWNTLIQTRPRIWMTLNSCQLTEYTIRSIIECDERDAYSRFILPVISDYTFIDSNLVEFQEHETTSRSLLKSFEETDVKSLLSEVRSNREAVEANVLFSRETRSRSEIETSSQYEAYSLLRLITDVESMDARIFLIRHQTSNRSLIETDEQSEREALRKMISDTNFFLSVVAEEQLCRRKLIGSSRKEKKIILTALYLGSEGLISGIQMLKLEKEAYESMTYIQHVECESRVDLSIHQELDNSLAGMSSLLQKSVSARHYIETKQLRLFSDLVEQECQLRPRPRPKQVAAVPVPSMTAPLLAVVKEPLIVLSERGPPEELDMPYPILEGEPPFYNSPLREAMILDDGRRYVENLVDSAPFSVWKSRDESKLW